MWSPLYWCYAEAAVRNSGLLQQNMSSVPLITGSIAFTVLKSFLFFFFLDILQLAVHPLSCSLVLIQT